MKVAANTSRFQKYAVLGGVASVAKQTLFGTTTLTEIARRLSVSRECVRQELMLYLGAPAYKKCIGEKRARAKAAREPRTLSATEALRFFADPEKTPLARCFKSILLSARSCGLDLGVRICAGKRPVLLTPRGHPIYVRIAFPAGKTKENAFGRHRFKITRDKCKNYPIAVFCIATSSSHLCYIFPGKDISKLNGLALRYQDLSRKSKYSKALNAWAAIAGQ